MTVALVAVAGVDTVHHDQAVVDAVVQRHPESKVILLGLTPNQGLLNWIRRYNALMSELADGRHVYYYDPLPAFMQDEKTVSKKLLRDGVHPSPAGYEVFAREIEQAIVASHRK